MIPSLILWLKLGQRTFAIVYLAIVVVLSLFTSNLTFLILLLASLFYLFPSIVMGKMYKKFPKPLPAVSAGIFVMLAEMVLIIFALSLTGTNIIETTREIIWTEYQSMAALLTQEVPEDFISDLTYMASAMIPTSMVGYAVYVVAITHWMTRLLMKKEHVHLPSFPPIREWMLPKSLVWYYVIALLLNVFFTFEQGSFIYMILVNLIPVLAFAFAVQAIAFLFYVAHVKKWNKALPVIGILTFPVISPYLSILGVFDVAFGIRKGFVNK